MQQSIRARIIRIGNSRGLRIPKVWLEQLNFGDEVELCVHQDSLIIRPAHAPREGWSAVFKAMAQNFDDTLVDEPRATLWDHEEWQW